MGALFKGDLEIPLLLMSLYLFRYIEPPRDVEEFLL